MLIVLVAVSVLVVAGGVVVALGSGLRQPALRRAGFAVLGVGMGILVLFVGLIVFGMLFGD